jgi:hypothetical protein
VTAVAKNKAAFLRLVHSVDDDGRSPSTDNAITAAQGLFFPSSAPNTLIFTDWDHISLSELLDIVELSKPKAIFDFRVTPRFDLESLTRRRFFALLDGTKCQYIDLLGRAGVSKIGGADSNPALIAAATSEVMAALPAGVTGPFVFLHDDAFFDDVYIHDFATALPAPRSKWQVFKPSSRPSGTVAQESGDDGRGGVTPLVRRAIFISHATPDDNEFVDWISAKLMLAGYEVWTDISKLQGGDTFWGDIEDAIRTNAAKVVVINSKYTKAKKGVRKEVYLSLKVGETLKRNRFVIPIRIDDTPFEETFIELVDIQAIDCREDWLKGLTSLLSVLHRDGVPRRENGISNTRFSDLAAKAIAPPIAIASKPEQLITNWLPVIANPQEVHFYECAGLMPADIPPIALDLSVPAFGYFVFLATTASIERASTALGQAGFGYVKLKLRATVPWEPFCRAQWGDLPKPSFGEARRFGSQLVNRAVSLSLQLQPMLCGHLANNKPFWFYQNDHFAKNEVKFSDFRGVSIRRQIVGYSQKRRVYWHFGLQFRSAIVDQALYLQMSPHVTFSNNGKTLLSSKAQLHSLRRSFCRSWWNKRWRDLMQAFVYAITSGSEEWNIDVGGVAPLIFDAKLLQLTSPQSPFVPEEVQTKVEGVNDEIDEIADDWDEAQLAEDEDAELTETEGAEPEL